MPLLKRFILVFNCLYSFLFNCFPLLTPICNQCAVCCFHYARHGLQIRGSGRKKHHLYAIISVNLFKSLFNTIYNTIAMMLAIMNSTYAIILPVSILNNLSKNSTISIKTHIDRNVTPTEPKSDTVVANPDSSYLFQKKII